jgi:hypothetical protein
LLIKLRGQLLVGGEDIDIQQFRTRARDLLALTAIAEQKRYVRLCSSTVCYSFNLYSLANFNVDKIQRSFWGEALEVRCYRKNNMQNIACGYILELARMSTFGTVLTKTYVLSANIKNVNVYNLGSHATFVHLLTTVRRLNQILIVFTSALAAADWGAFVDVGLR